MSATRSYNLAATLSAKRTKAAPPTYTEIQSDREVQDGACNVGYRRHTENSPTKLHDN